MYDPSQLLPLYLPFVTLLNQSGFVGKIQALSQSLEEQVGKRICVELNAEEDGEEADDSKAELPEAESAPAVAAAAAAAVLSSATAGTTLRNGRWCCVACVVCCVCGLLTIECELCQHS